jgi:hypothetical protein
MQSKKFRRRNGFFAPLALSIGKRIRLDLSSCTVNLPPHQRK